MASVSPFRPVQLASSRFRKSIGPADLGLEFSIPIFVIQGEEDFTTPTALARQYLESINAPRKEFVLIKGVDTLRCSRAPINFYRSSLRGCARWL